MKTVNIGELKNQLSGYLQFVKDGEEVVIRDRNTPVARILPFRPSDSWAKEQHLIASGAMKMPEEEMDWDKFFISPAGNVSNEVAVDAATAGRGDR